MHWKKHSHGLCIVGLGGGSSTSYPPRSVATPRTSGRLITLQNSQRLFASPSPSRGTPDVARSASSAGSLPGIGQDLPRQSVDFDIGVQGRAKAIHPSITTPRDVVGGVGDDSGCSGMRLSCSGPPSEKTDSKSSEDCSTESKVSQPAFQRTFPPGRRTRSPAGNSVASLGELSVTSISLSSRSGHQPSQARKTGLESNDSLKDCESDYLSEIIGEYVSSPSPAAVQEVTPRGTPRRGTTTYHSKLLRMRSLVKDNGHPTDSLTSQTVELEKGNIQSFKKLLVLTHIPNNSKNQKSKPNSDPGAMSESSGSSSSDSTNRERSMVMGLHQLSRQHRKQSGQRVDNDSSNPELPSLQPGPSIPDDRPGSTLVDQWLGSCVIVGNRLDTESTKRRIEFCVPCIEEETESLS